MLYILLYNRLFRWNGESLFNVEVFRNFIDALSFASDRHCKAFFGFTGLLEFSGAGLGLKRIGLELGSTSIVALEDSGLGLSEI